MNFSSSDLENFLANIQIKLPVLTLQEKYLLKDPMTHIVGPVHFVSTCTVGKVTEKSKALAQDILKYIP